ncbi:hypothetical protein CsSME_00019207 [Camellia sinensis var. sinensis]
MVYICYIDDTFKGCVNSANGSHHFDMGCMKWVECERGEESLLWGARVLFELVGRSLAGVTKAFYVVLRSCDILLISSLKSRHLWSKVTTLCSGSSSSFSPVQACSPSGSASRHQALSWFATWFAISLSSRLQVLKSRPSALVRLHLSPLRKPALPLVRHRDIRSFPGLRLGSPSLSHLDFRFSLVRILVHDLGFKGFISSSTLSNSISWKQLFKMLVGKISLLKISTLR